MLKNTSELTIQLQRAKWLALVATAIGVAVVWGAGFLLTGGSPATASQREVAPAVRGAPEAVSSEKITGLEVPAKVVARVESGSSPTGQKQPDGKGASAQLIFNQPSDAALLGDRLLILDAGNGRLVELDLAGKPIRVLDGAVDERMALHLPMAMAVHDGRLYIADSGAGRVVIFDPMEARVDGMISLPRQDGDQQQPRPIGIAVAPGGDVFLSDADNQRVVRYRPDGTITSFVGTGKREAGEYGLSTPGSVALDRAGNVYVVDILNSRVMKYSPDGKFLLQIGQRGDTEGTFSRPKGVAIDDGDNVYVSDALLAAVQVFDAQGRYKGLIGRTEPGNKNSDSIFSAPAELRIIDGQLYVTDRLAGLFVLDIGS